ncbi:Cysteine-rich protein 2-binding protein [Mortierella claussenii]|nr:Cysteine-rich protein 2-binding protein [Mortierella claussenii]
MDKHPEQQYFRWKEEICKFIDDYWSYLLPDKEQSPTWNNTVASVLSVQNHIFHSGVEIKGASELKPKNKASQKSGNPRPVGSKSKEKRPRAKGPPSKKKTKFDETSSDDDFHTSAKPRPQSTAPTTRIKSRQFSFSSGSSLSSAGDSDDSLDEENFWKSDEEREVRPIVHLHGIPACIQHHFNPSGLDFSAGPIHLEEIFRLTDLIDEYSPGRLIHRSSAVEIKAEAMQKIMNEKQYSQDDTDFSDEDDNDDIDGSSGVSDVESEVGSGSESMREAQARMIAAQSIGGKRFSHMPIPGRSFSAWNSSPSIPGGKHGRRKSSLKDPLSSFESPRKPKNVSMADDVEVSYLSPSTSMRVSGGKQFSQAHIDAMTRAMSSSKSGAKPKARAKPKPKAVSSLESPSPYPHIKSSLDGLSAKELTPKEPPTLTLQQIQRQQEWHILQVLEDASKTQPLPTVAARFKRKLHLKRLKAFLHLPLFNMESYMRQHLSSPQDLAQLSKHIPPDPYELRRLREEEFRTKIQKIDHTPYANSFASRLLGQPVERNTRKPWEPLWKSPFSGKVLKDFIWRDYESRSVMMDVLDEIKSCQGRPAKVPGANLGLVNLFSRAGIKRRRNELSTAIHAMNVVDSDQELAHDLSRQQLQDRLSKGSRAPIDYCYFRKEHLTQVNETLCRRFWPGIDMTEALQYPEYSVVVLYKRLVVGCAFMTPEGYITYVAVSAGWEKAGIGQFMLYHLMQASEGKDITLHVSANNPAMIMYQKFGFKPEQFLINFYKEYLPQDSLMCHNAFFLQRLRGPVGNTSHLP